MYRVLWVVAVIAVAALTTSIIGTVVERSDSAHQSSEIGVLNRQEATNHKAINALNKRLHDRGKTQLSRSAATKNSSSVLSRQKASRSQTTTGITTKPAIGPAALPYSGLTWRHALLLN